METSENRYGKPPAPGSSLLEQYAEHLGGLNITDDEAEEFLAALYHIMRCFVDLGFRIAPIDNAVFDSLTDLSNATTKRKGDA